MYTLLTAEDHARAAHENNIQRLSLHQSLLELEQWYTMYAMILTDGKLLLNGLLHINDLQLG